MKRLFKIIFIKIPLAFILLSITIVVLLKWMPVAFTPLMLKRAIEFRDDKAYRTHKKWVSLKKISPEMAKAVIASEDNRFNEHSGFDFEELKRMHKEHIEKGKKLRGCSTISQQTAKNCFTWCSDTWVRKGFEAYWTVLIELIWGKERIMEVYLNVIETGKGVYGVQAAADKYFGKDAAALTRREAAAIAVCLPSPLKRDPAHPTDYIRSRTSAISSLIPKISYPEWVENKQVKE